MALIEIVDQQVVNNDINNTRNFASSQNKYGCINISTRH